MTDIKIDVTGDPVGGWIVDVHDGIRNEVYWPVAATKEEAYQAALDAHRTKHFPDEPHLPETST